MTDYGRVDVRREREDLLPVPADLRPPDESADGVCRRLVAVVRREAIHCRGEIVCVGGGDQPVEQPLRLRVCRVHIFTARD